MKNKFHFFFLGILMLGILFAYMGCEDERIVGSEATQIQANGTLTPTSHTQAQGTLFVADQNGNTITGITSQNVTVRLIWTTPTTDSVNGTIYIESLSQSGKNVAVALTMDYSGSMYVNWNSVTGKYQRLADMENGVKTFINAIQSNDKCEIIKFDSYVYVVQPLTNSKSLLLHAVDSTLSLGGSTALFQSIYTGIQGVVTQSSSLYARAVVAFTDGGENASSIDMPTLLQAARTQGVPVYTIGLLDSTYHTSPPGQYPYDNSELNLVQIADSTGGFYFYAPNTSQLSTIYNRISGQLSNSYTVAITWPTTKLPAAGTVVTAVIIINYNGMIITYRRTFTMQ